ncbi:stage II sporulation protein M [Murimonas intestini]|uniref:Stage II sporulation protein M n=1 Tax=Murimonas intestini TaxID=1337051 RepID=A0AB73T4V5_9FIRM|nr:stage II sporulation protein M [Murimonas intestini]MCR1840603.1 stage II sporulation protein M [Murimonas intestini]MCR1865344.1 stage II sporulation protein M [Murimonas intestini]MCR1882945.1 stage II sporulation protein M [Murimonas intestini]
MKNLHLQKKTLWLLGGLFAAGFLTGILGVNLWGKEDISQAGILSTYYISQYKYLQIDSGALFFFLLFRRVKWLVLLWALGYTAVGLPAALIYGAWMGLSAGIVMTVAVMKMGLSGLLFCLGAMLPQNLIYLPVILIFLYFVCQKGREKYQRGKLVTGLQWDNDYTAAAGICLLLFVLGILTESYVNPWVLRQLLNIF